MIPTVYHQAYLDYYFGPAHPFSPDRLRMVWDALEALGLDVDWVEPDLAMRADVLSVHDEAFVAAVEAASDGAPPPEATRFGLDTSDVPVFDGMDAAARALVGGTKAAMDRVVAGEAPRVLQLGGGLHHARHAEAAGFCVYNDLAVAMQHARNAGLRVAYIDIDVHHGDGVQWLFYDAPDVLTISLHETGRTLYPGTGFVEELGEGDGKGFKLNVPLEPFTADASYLDAFERVVPHVLGWFGPDVLLVQCGADAHAHDPLAHLSLSTHAYETLFRRLLELAREHTDGQAVFTLGGGYDPDATARIWLLLVHVLNDLPLPEHLPKPWLERWQNRLGRRLTPTLHDAGPFAVGPKQDAIAERNRHTSQRLLDLAAVCWF